MKLKFLLSIIILLSAAAPAQNVDVRDYQIPISKAQNLKLNAAWNWSQSGDSVSSNTAFGSAIFRSFYSSLPLAWFINVDAAGTKTFAAYTHDVRFNGSFSKYVWEQRNWFAFATVNVIHLNTYRQVASDLTSGFGYGRYIDATALAKAVRIEDHLLSDSIISGYLPKETMLKMADIIEREDEYATLYPDLFEHKWIEDISIEIEKSGMLKEDHLSALGTIRIREVLLGTTERVNDRYYGWDVRLGVLFPVTTADKTTPGNPNLSIGAQYSVPIGWRMQLNTRADVFSPMDSTFIKNTGIRVGIDFVYELSSRINLLLGYNLNAFALPTAKTKLNSDFTLSFLYYLENRVYFTVNSGIRKQDGSRTFMSNNIGLRYDIF